MAEHESLMELFDHERSRIVKVEQAFMLSTMTFLPNSITAFRILVTPVLIYCIFQQTPWFATISCILFTLGAISDFADGLVARAIKHPSQLGRHLDPAADKVLILGTLIPLAWLYPQHIPWWAVLVIGFRDAAVTGLRMRADSTGRSLPTIGFAKIKTGLQMIFLGLFLLILVFQYLPEFETLTLELLQSRLIFWGMIIVLLITCLTGFSYLRIFPWTRLTDLNK